MINDTKTCKKCLVAKALDEFYKKPRMKDGHSNTCKSCESSAARQWQKDHPERHRANKKRWNQTDKARASAKAYREANVEFIKQLNKEWREDNREYDRERKRLQQPAKRRRAKIKEAFVEDIIPLIVLERDDGVCGICGGDVDPFNFHVDHIKPLSKGGEHSYANTQVTHPLCNLQKGARMEPSYV